MALAPVNPGWFYLPGFTFTRWRYQLDVRQLVWSSSQCGIRPGRSLLSTAVFLGESSRLQQTDKQTQRNTDVVEDVFERVVVEGGFIDVEVGHVDVVVVV